LSEPGFVGLKDLPDFFVGVFLLGCFIWDVLFGVSTGGIVDMYPFGHCCFMAPLQGWRVFFGAVDCCVFGG
jgi:hypothetical protein